MRTALARSPDVCVIDVMMPKLDGYQVTESLRGAVERIEGALDMTTGE